MLASLTDLSGIGDARAYELYTHYETPEKLLDAPESIVAEFHYLDADTYDGLQSLDKAIETYRHRFNKYEIDGITILGIEDARYPDAVRDGPAPVLIYAKGDLDTLTGTAIGVSGSRETNETGQQWIRSLSSAFAEKGNTIVSGGARGADKAAHQGALEFPNSTIAVLGTGVNIAYPPENESLFERIVKTGGLLLSMRPPDAEPTRHSFIDRNELLAALSDAMIFVATDGSGGTIAQYKIALKQNKPTFVPPTDLNIEPSSGLTKLRESNDTATIQSSAELADSISTTKSQQKNLDEWT